MKTPLRFRRPYFLLIFASTSFIGFSQSRGYLLPSDNWQWQFSNSGDHGNIDTDIDLPDAWKICTGGFSYFNDEIVIAIVDGGVHERHTDLIQNLWVNRNEIADNGIDDDGNGFIDDVHGWNFKTNNPDIGNTSRGHWHVTSVNGIIGANGTNSFGISGVNKEIKLLNLVRCDNTSSIFDCYRYIFEQRDLYNRTQGKQGAFIVAVNNSWGKDSAFAYENETWCDWYNKLGLVGILSVVSAPNDAVDIDNSGDMPSDCGSDFILSVTNSDPNDCLAAHAGYGRQNVDLAAPGEYSYTTLNNGSYGYFGGTSAAAAYVSGAIGLLYAIPSYKLCSHIKEYPSTTALLIKQAILDGTEKTTELQGKTLSGGRLNCANAVKQICAFFEEQELLKILHPDGNQVIATYPNPAIDELVIAIELSETCKPTVVVFNQQGQKVLEKKYPLYPCGIHFIQLNIQELTKGSYYVHTDLSEFTRTSILFKL